MVMRAMRQGASGGVLKFILFGLLIMAVGGLVLMDVGGFFSGGGIRNSDVIKVGRESIPIANFDRNVRRTLGRVGIQPEEAYKLGYIDEIANGEIRSSLMYQSSLKAGLLVGNERIAKQIHEMVEPMVEDGQTPQQVLDAILRNQGMSEGEMVSSIARESASGLLTSALQSGFSGVSDNMLRDFYLYKNETRMINLVVFPDKNFKDAKKPTEDQLKSLYESLKETYAIPESRTVNLAFLDDKNIKATVDISEDDIKAAYDENIDAYSSPEQRVLEQSILKTEDDAKTVIEKVKAGTSLKEATRSITNDTLAYVGESAFEEDGLVPEIGAMAFGSDELNQPMGPVQTPLGWHVIMLKGIKEPAVKPLENVRKDIETELRQAALSDQMYEAANAVDDQLAGGGSFEDTAKEHNLKLVTLSAFNAFGQDKDGNDALKEYDTARDLILKTTFELSEGETSNVMEMADGRFMAVNVKSVTPKSYKPFEDVKAAIETKWTDDQRHSDNRVRVMAFVAQLKAGSTSLKDIAAKNGATIRTIANIKRDGQPSAPLNAQAMATVFETPVNDYALLGLDGSSAIAEIADVKFPKRDNISEKDLLALRDEYIKSVQSEGVLMYLESRRQDTGVKINRALIDSTYGPGREAQ